MKTAVVYYSKHHGNTKKVLDSLCKNNDITLINVLETKNVNLSEYDLIGFASGIYYSKFHKTVLSFAQNNLSENKKVFFVFTYGVKKDGYTNEIRKIAEEKSAEIVGEFGCLGYNTFGPFKLIGGIAKGHPDNCDFSEAIKFYNEINR